MSRPALIAACSLVSFATLHSQRQDRVQVAEAAVIRLRDAGDSSAWPLLRQSSDNTTRSLIVRNLARLGVAPEIVFDRLRQEADTSARRALISALGEYAPDAIARATRRSIADLMSVWFETDPDPGIHSAAKWLLRVRGFGDAPARPGALTGSREWYVSAEGHTMTVVRGPSSVRMGSPADEAGRQPASDSPAEPQHVVTVPRTFAIAATEVTVAEFRRFLDANPEAKRGYQYADAPSRMAEVLDRFSPEAENPAIAVTWYEAAMYCNWLSAREGLPPSEWVYPAGPLADGARLPVNYLERTGYRLPTEPEWELAARAGTTTARFFGDVETMLGDYAWFARNPPRTKDDPVDPDDPQRTAPVGRLKPNDLGLFDVYGNVWEWTQDRVERYQTTGVHADREDPMLVVSAGDARTRRGGAFPYPSAMARSAARGTVASLPGTRRDNVGFRVARTLRIP